MPNATIQECQELVQVTLNDMYPPQAIISSMGGIDIYLGQTFKGNITMHEIEGVIHSSKNFLKLIRNKVE